VIESEFPIPTGSAGTETDAPGETPPPLTLLKGA